MNKIKFYKFLIAGLLISNIILLAFMFLKKGKRAKHHTPREIVIKKLNFTENQVTHYDEFIAMHSSDIAKIHKEIKGVKNQLYSNLSIEPQDSVLIDSLQRRVANVKLIAEQVHYRHFMDIKSICTPEQLPAFNILTKEMAKIFSPRQGRQHNRKRK